jgi:esterase FrsA
MSSRRTLKFGAALSMAFAATASASAPTPSPSRPPQVLQRDELATPLAIPKGGHRVFAIDVPANARNVEVQLIAGSPVGEGAARGPALLRVKAHAPPSLGNADCRAFSLTPQARCAIAGGAAARHYVRIDAVLAGISNASLIANWEDAAPNDADRYDDWYRSITPRTWIDQGADAQVVDRVLRRIERAKGARRDPAQPDTVIAHGPGHWIHEWTAAGDAALRQARRAAHRGQRDSAKANYLEAVHYFNIASYPHLNHDAHAMAALEASQSAYREAAPFLAGTFKLLELEHDGVPFRAYLHVPEGNGPFPVLVKSAGSDIVKDIFYRSWERALAPRGIAVLLLDMPGIGDSRAHVLTPASDKLHVAAFKHLKRHAKAIDPRLDAGRIAVEGASFGGHAAGRFHLRRDVGAAGVVSVCGPMDQVFRKSAQAYEAMPRMTMDAVRSRLGVAPDASWTVLAERMHRFALGPAGQGLLPATAPSGTPLLAIGTTGDPVAPLEDIAMLADASTRADLRIFDIDGHCPDRVARDAIIADWLGDLFAR